jgi:hypothetical protein
MSEPTQLGDIAALPDSDSGELPRWPKVVGTISIVWASLGLVCGGCGVVWLMAMPSFMKGAEQKFGPFPQELLPNPTQMLVMGVGFLWAILLRVAGITTVGRRGVGRPLHLVHACGALVLTVIGTVLQVKANGDIAAWLAANPTNEWAKQMNTPGSAIGRQVGLFFGVFLGFAWPLFCVVWFAPSKRGVELARRDTFI